MESWIIATILYLYHLYNVSLYYAVSLWYRILELVERMNLSTPIEDYTNSENVKIPKHIAMLFTNEMNSLDIKSIARLFRWCIQIGTQHITLYDELGHLKDLQRELRQSIINELENTKYEKPIKCIDSLNILSRSDGRPQFVEHVRQLVKLGPDRINFELVNKRFAWSSDPEFLIIFGYPLRLYGFPPWPLRLTEIFSIPTHRSIPQKVFVDNLLKYSKTTQRIGV